jgi:endonuclease/exonuclease/phosphatase family metal-dependent hydrolase
VDSVLQGQYASRSDLDEPIRLLTWNIERGLDLPGVMDFVEKLKPDLCLFQEVDLFAKRTARRDVADLVAERFDFNYAFGVEWEELSQGSRSEPAYQGQAVFARCPIQEPRILRFSRHSDFWHPRWYLPRLPVFQPRRGGRMALTAQLPWGRTRLVVYDVHLESRGDDDLRLLQLSQVTQDCLRYPINTPIVVAGDLNTRDRPSPLREFLIRAGFQDACEVGDCSATRGDYTLDWIFTRGPVLCSDTRVHREVRASDHFPLSTNLTLHSPQAA